MFDFLATHTLLILRKIKKALKIEQMMKHHSCREQSRHYELHHLTKWMERSNMKLKWKTKNKTHRGFFLRKKGRRCRAQRHRSIHRPRLNFPEENKEWEEIPKNVDTSRPDGLDSKFTGIQPVRVQRVNALAHQKCWWRTCLAWVRV